MRSGQITYSTMEVPFNGQTLLWNEKSIYIKNQELNLLNVRGLQHSTACH